ncbi:hypothetical protein RHO12_01725 [Orbus sturtevantii]|uniref:PFGI-1 class ICE element type IV pilus protein PilL2 n=1 Tax=Orbus sturtevantii TaxID=3074109 RepID=UPI00370DC377
MKIRLIVLLPLFMLSACSNKPVPRSLDQPKEPQKYLQAEPKNTQTIQTDRYTLVELEQPLQNTVLDQIIDTSIPKGLSLSVKDGMNYALNQSGFILCQNTQVNVLYSKNLPKIHYKLGPVKLSDALQIMAGPAWQLTVDEVEREVCFELNSGYQIKIKPSTVTPVPVPTEQVQIQPQIDIEIESYPVPPKEIKSPLLSTKKLVESKFIKNEGKHHE